MSKFYPQFLLAVANDHVQAQYSEGFNSNLAIEKLAELQSGLVIRQRQWLDFVDNTKRPEAQSSTQQGDDRYRQVLPYVTVRNSQGLLLPYLRGSAVGENRLAGNISVGFGGHVDLIDVVHRDSVINLLKTIELNISRELAEELIINRDGVRFGLCADIPVMEAGELRFNGLINDNSNEVGRLHLGFSFDYVLKPGYDATCREEELRVLPWCEDSKVFDMPDTTVESWSSLYLSRLH
jgi:predicted NUDIX family phosphoesterase